MADKRENQMTAVTATNLRCLDASGNSGVVNADNFLENKEVVRGKNQLLGSVDFNDITAPGVYYASGGDFTNHPFSYCQLIVTKSGFTIAQRAIEMNTGNEKIRILWGSNWSFWKQTT